MSVGTKFGETKWVKGWVWKHLLWETFGKSGKSAQTIIQRKLGHWIDLWLMGFAKPSEFLQIYFQVQTLTSKTVLRHKKLKFWQHGLFHQRQCDEEEDKFQRRKRISCQLGLACGTSTVDRTFFLFDLIQAQYNWDTEKKDLENNPKVKLLINLFAQANISK